MFSFGPVLEFLSHTFDHIFSPVYFSNSFECILDLITHYCFLKWAQCGRKYIFLVQLMEYEIEQLVHYNSPQHSINKQLSLKFSHLGANHDPYLIIMNSITTFFKESDRMPLTSVISFILLQTTLRPVIWSICPDVCQERWIVFLSSVKCFTRHLHSDFSIRRIKTRFLPSTAWWVLLESLKSIILLVYEFTHYYLINLTVQ